MHIAIVTPRYPPTFAGGGEKSAELLASKLVQTDRIDSIVVYSFDGVGHSCINGVAVNRLGSISPVVTEYQNLVAFPKLRSQLPQFDIVHAYNMELHPVVGYLAGKDQITSVATLNSYHFLPKSVTNTQPGHLERLYELLGYPTTGRILLRYVKQNDQFIALSRAVADIYEDHGFPENKIEIIPNMFDPSFETPERTTHTNRFRLLYVGSLAPNKGVAYLVRAMANLPSDFELRIVGPGDQATTLESLADEYGVGDRTEICGKVPYDQVKQEYANADLFVHPGVWPEPFGRTILEAMQAGLPVVCTNIGAPPEIVPDKQLVCEPADPDSLAEAIQRGQKKILQDCTCNPCDVLESYSPETIASRIVDLYYQIV